MNVKTWKTKRKSICGVTVTPDGTEFHFASDKPINGGFPLPIQWNGENAIMYFYPPSWHKVNTIATQMLDHPCLEVRGDVHIITHTEWRYKIRAWTSRENVMEAIENLGLDVPPAIVGINWGGCQDIYAATKHDQFAIRMCL